MCFYTQHPIMVASSTLISTRLFKKKERKKYFAILFFAKLYIYYSFEQKIYILQYTSTSSQNHKTWKIFFKYISYNLLIIFNILIYFLFLNWYSFFKKKQMYNFLSLIYGIFEQERSRDFLLGFKDLGSRPERWQPCV